MTHPEVSGQTFHHIDERLKNTHDSERGNDEQTDGEQKRSDQMRRNRPDARRLNPHLPPLSKAHR